MSIALKISLSALAVLLLIALAAFVFTFLESRRIAARYPNIGEVLDVDGVAMNSVLVKPDGAADLPPIVFIHGASGNLRDPLGAFLEPLRGRAELLFVDRPGHGFSERGGERGESPGGQADLIAGLMRARGIEKAIIVGHSFGGAITAALALNHPDLVSGLVFLSPATHPWEGGVDWYYDLANVPFVGTFFCNTITLPAGLLGIDAGIRAVFHPNEVPADYREKAAIPLLLRPANFCANARDVANLLPWVRKAQPRYHEITAPTVIITGDSDDIVYAHIHSAGLKRDLPNSDLVTVHHLGHKSDYMATDLAIAAMEKVAGMNRDLDAIAKIVETRLAP